MAKNRSGATVAGARTKLTKAGQQGAKAEKLIQAAKDAAPEGVDWRTTRKGRAAIGAQQKASKRTIAADQALTRRLGGKKRPALSKAAKAQDERLCKAFKGLRKGKAVSAETRKTRRKLRGDMTAAENRAKKTAKYKKAGAKGKASILSRARKSVRSKYQKSKQS